MPAAVAEVSEAASPAALVTENAARKARAGWEVSGAGEGDVVLGCDTEVFLDERALGKAATEAEARERLEALSGRTHEVLSGIAIAEGGQGNETGNSFPKGCVTPERLPLLTSGVARTTVTFRALDEATIQSYLASGEWRDRAGAYAIQGLGAVLVESLQGDFSNVVGLPLRLLLELAPGLLPPISSDSA